jgi:tripartite-type tricarboxylate transporter receptor subunit TctC
MQARLLFLSAVLATSWITAAPAQNSAPKSDSARYFQGKRITIHAGYAPGGTAGTEALVVVRHLAKHIPGTPNVLLNHMPGGGGRLLANYIYNAVKPDGLNIGRISNLTAMDDLLDEPSVKFEADKFNWIGAFGADAWLAYFRSESGFKSIDAIRSSGKKPKLGAISVGHKSFMNARLIEEVTGVDLDIIPGYAGGTEIGLAITRGEIDGYVVGYEAFAERTLAEYQAGRVLVPVQSGDKDRKSLPALEAAPTIWSQARPETQQLVQLAAMPWDRPFVVPPNTPPEVVQVLRAAFKALSTDPAFLEEHQRAVGGTMQFTPGEKLQEDVDAFMKASPSTVQLLKRLFTQD